jgi:hypothetical protein
LLISYILTDYSLLAEHMQEGLDAQSLTR